MEEFGLRRLQGQGRWWQLEGWGEVEVVRQPTYCCPGGRAGRGDMLTGAGLPAPFLGRKAKNLASGSQGACQILRPCKGEVADQLDEDLGARWSWEASEVDFHEDCGPGSCP